MSDFKAGLEAAAKFVELMQAEHQRVPHLADLIRSLSEEFGTSPVEAALFGQTLLRTGGDGSIEHIPLQSVLMPMTAADEAFAQFRAAYKPLGFRNNWVAARKKFDLLVKKEKVDPAAIVAGTIAYAETRPERQYVPAPEVFLNKRQFEYDWANSGARRQPSQANVESFFQNRVDGQS